MLKTIQSKLIAGVFVLILLLLSSFSAFQYFKARSILVDGLQSEANNIAIPLWVGIKDQLEQFGDKENIQQSLESYAGLIGFTEFPALIEAKAQLNDLLLVDPQGKIIAHHQPESIGALVESELIAMIQESNTPLLEKGKSLYIFSPFFFEEQFVGGLFFSYSNEKLLSLRNELLLVTSGLFAVFIILGVMGAWLIAKTITKPIDLLVNAIHDIVNGEGDLTKTIHINSHDEIGEFAKYFNIFIENIRQVVGGINQDSISLSQAAEELAATAHQNQETINILDQAIQSNTQNIANNAATIQEIARTIQITTKEIQETAQIANLAESKAAEGSGAVILGNSAMAKLAESSQKIEGIINVITGISRQTNLLSLNAAIEAAKAGDYGKGFAVAADEVRILAERSSGSVVEIRQLIDQSSSNVQEGNRINQQTGEILKVIIEHVNGISQRIQLTSDSMIEQDIGIQRMAEVADDLSQNSKDNSAAIRQLSQATHQVASTIDSLAALSDSLSQQVAQFKTGYP